MRFFGAVKGGAIKKKGLSAKKAGEMVKGSKASKLPEKAKKKKGKFNAGAAASARKKHFGLK